MYDDEEMLGLKFICGDGRPGLLYMETKINFRQERLGMDMIEDLPCMQARYLLYINSFYALCETGYFVGILRLELWTRAGLAESERVSLLFSCVQCRYDTTSDIAGELKTPSAANKESRVPNASRHCPRSATSSGTDWARRR